MAQARGTSARPGPAATPPVGAARELASGPVLVLTYGFAGGQRLQDLLRSEPTLGCTTRTGILSAALNAAEAWSRAEDSVGDQMSALAASSVKALITPMLAIIRARTGGTRWCETATDSFAAAVFLRFFPDTRVICLHRACPDVAYAVLAANPWGICGPVYARHLAAYPASTAAALAAWWVDQAGPLADFEAGHPHACMRVRYEDIVADPGQALTAIRGFIGLEPASAIPAANATAWTPSAGPAAPGCGADFPADQLPPQLASQVDALHVRLGYPPLERPR